MVKATILADLLRNLARLLEAKGKRATSTSWQALRTPANREALTVNDCGHGFPPLKKHIKLRQQVAPPDQRMQLAMLLTEISPPQHPSRLCAL